MNAKISTKNSEAPMSVDNTNGGDEWNDSSSLPSLGSNSSEIDPNHLNLRQLRVELKRLGLSPSGLKAELRRRLKNAWGVHSESPHASGDESNASNISSKGDSSPERRLDDSDASVPLRNQLPSIKRKNYASKSSKLNNQAKTIKRIKRKYEYEDEQLSEDDVSDAEWEEAQHKNKKIAAKGTGISIYLGQGQFELYKANLQRQHDIKIREMYQQIETLNEQLQKKEEKVQDLRKALKEKTATLTSLGYNNPESELGQGFGCLQTVIMEKLNKENNKVSRNLRAIESVV
eukprot:TRINITY_DN981_c0_g1_i1.p1 TRINITY_DN981_c0_g1~~TRINITY_DN981_c0_g1_i1.p1  ORF type:complete len:289 (-),score=73.64 TRINITY_DN981_c0_g1_i1:50-916(-)